MRKCLSQAWASLQSFTDACHDTLSTEVEKEHRSFRGSVPYDVFPAMRSHLAPMRATAPVTLRPRAFSTPRRFAPLMTYRACFIPNPSMGLTLRGFHPPVQPYVLSNAASLLQLAKHRGSMSALTGVMRPLLQGLTQHENLERTDRG